MNIREELEKLKDMLETEEDFGAISGLPGLKLIREVLPP
jgi:hypothetical protein